MTKPKKPSKADLVLALQDKLMDEHWELIHQLLGREIGGPRRDTGKARFNFLSGLFTRTITRGRAKGKGRELQQWLAAQIGNLLGEDHGKDTEICSRAGSQSGPDVAMSSRICKLFPLTAECKSGDSWSIPAAIEQCKRNLYPGTDWMLCLDRPSRVKKDRIPPIICLSGETFFRILREGLCQNSKPE